MANQVCYGLDVDKYLSQTTDRQEADSGDFTVWRQLLDRNTGLNIKPNLFDCNERVSIECGLL